MDKNAIKKFAVWARRELIARVSQKAAQYGIEENSIVDGSADHIGELLLTADQKKQRQALIAQLKEKGYQQVMEEVAYTWFNRFAALRFMEVNNYLPSHVRVFTDDEDNFKPQMITEAIHLELDGLDMEKVYALKEANQTEELYRYLLITQCNALNQILPKMFQKISDYTELLLPDNLLREGSVIEQMLSMIPQEDWLDAVQIIGWLYQYYNAEKKDEVFAALKKNVKITKENIPAATQLFTPDWIVRYMVENSLGRLWLEHLAATGEGYHYLYGDDGECSAATYVNADKVRTLKANWKYYLDEAKQEPEVEEQLAEIRKEYAPMTPEKIKCIDPCCGSGHILAYLFDVLVQIYESYGYTTREAVENIVKNNLYGLDIDDRAAQLAYFAVMMKARQYDRRFFSRQIQPNVYAIQESNGIDRYALEYFCNGDTKLQAAMDSIIKETHDAKEYGSILNITPVDFAALYARFDEVRDDISMSKESVLNNLLSLVQVAEALAQKYDVVVTNPPYMGSSGMSAKLTDFVKKNYPDSKSDFFSVFMERADAFAKANKFTSLITMESWMFLSSFEKLREKINQTKTIVNMVHMPYLGRGGTSLGINFGTAAVIMKKGCVSDYSAQYEYTVYYECDSEGIPFEFPARNARWTTAKQSNFSKIPGSPVAYWVSKEFLDIFNNKNIATYADVQEGLKTGDNERFIRKWYEIEFASSSMGNGKSPKWFYHTKGGDFRKWYGNQDDVLNYMDGGRELRSFKGSSLTGSSNYFKKNITYSRITSAKTSFRYTDEGAIPNMAGLALYPNDENIFFILGWLNTNIVCEILNFTNPTINFPPGTIAKLPVTITHPKKIQVSELVKQNIAMSRTDWDSFETSWDFEKHPLIRLVSTVADSFTQWEAECDNRFAQLKANEEELNRIFIDIYGLQDELTPEVEDKDVTVRKADLQRDIKSLISYAVGCMFGRYSPLKDGLLYAGGDWDYAAIQQELMDALGKNEFSSTNMVWDANFIDKDNIIPICDDEYFEDDIVGRFINFISAVYGKDALEENLKFIADALGGKGQPKEVLRNYFLHDFYADHCKIYQKRPIYWLFDSGKKNGFKALIYMHRYQPDTIARIRTDYVHEQQARYRTAIQEAQRQLTGATTADKVRLNKKLNKLTEQDAELRTYEEKIHHLADQMIPIDLDDGVKVNYAKFQDVLAKIK